MTILVAGHVEVADMELMEEGHCPPAATQTILNHVRGCESCHRTRELVLRRARPSSHERTARERKPATDRRARALASRRRLLLAWIMVGVVGATVAYFLYQARW